MGPPSRRGGGTGRRGVHQRRRRGGDLPVGAAGAIAVSQRQRSLCFQLCPSPNDPRDGAGVSSAECSVIAAPTAVATVTGSARPRET